MHVPRWAKVVGSVVAAMLWIVGIAGVPDDLQTWSKWLEWLSGNSGRWLVTGTAIVLLLLVWSGSIRESFRREYDEPRNFSKLRIEPLVLSSKKAVFNVENEGVETTVVATINWIRWFTDGKWTDFWAGDFPYRLDWDEAHGNRISALGIGLIKVVTVFDRGPFSTEGKYLGFYKAGGIRWETERGGVGHLKCEIEFTADPPLQEPVKEVFDILFDSSDSLVSFHKSDFTPLAKN